MCNATPYSFLSRCYSGVKHVFDMHDANEREWVGETEDLEACLVLHQRLSHPIRQTHLWSTPFPCTASSWWVTCSWPSRDESFPQTTTMSLSLHPFPPRITCRGKKVPVVIKARRCATQNTKSSALMWRCQHYIQPFVGATVFYLDLWASNSYLLSCALTMPSKVTKEMEINVEHGLGLGSSF